MLNIFKNLKENKTNIESASDEEKGIMITSWDVSYRYGLETTYNGALQTVNELLEILPEDD